MIKKDYDIRPLAAAVIVQAAREAIHDPTAREWLLTDAPLWFDGMGLDFDPAQVRRWIANGCKIPYRGALKLGA